MIARKLILYETYSRKDVHDLFEPRTRFTSRGGTWGLWGIVPIREKEGNFVIFVTFGKEQAGYSFDEWVTKQGVINWQSQPHQSLDDRQIQQLIHHDPTQNDIYLFLRTHPTDLYTYLGRLAYFTHDLKREQPVHILWQILDWNPPLTLLQSMGLNLRSEEPLSHSQFTGKLSFEWRRVQYPVDREELQNRIQKQIRAGLPTEALRFRDWFVYMNGQRLSAKWVFHLLTGADFSEFDAPTARDKLEKLGIRSYLVHPTTQTAQLSLDSRPRGNNSGDVNNKPQLPELKRSKEIKYIRTSVPTSPIIRIAETKQPLIVSVPLDNISPDEDERPQLPERKMGTKKNFIGNTIQRLTDLILDLAQLGEVGSKALKGYGISDSHLLQLLQSTLVISTPYAMVATPRLLSMLPIENRETLNELLHLSNWDYRGWGDFDLWA
ncbi:DUF3427 domain-containing protein, partial [bacterium]